MRHDADEFGLRKHLLSQRCSQPLDDASEMLDRHRSGRYDRSSLAPAQVTQRSADASKVTRSRHPDPQRPPCPGQGSCADDKQQSSPERLDERALLPERQRGQSDDAARIGLAWIDVAAGRFEAATVTADDVADHVLRLDPAECLCADRDRHAVEELIRTAGVARVVTNRPDWWFEPDSAGIALTKALGGRRLEGLGFEPDNDAAGIAAAGAVVAYLEENEPAAVGRIDTLAPWRPGLRMEIDEASRRSL